LNEGEFTTQVAETVSALSETAYPKKCVREREAQIKTELQREDNFTKPWNGEKQYRNFEAGKAARTEQIDGRTAFMLYDTCGFPLKQEIAAEHGLTAELEGFEAVMEEQTSHQEAHETIDLTAPDFLNQYCGSTNAYSVLRLYQPSTPAQVTGYTDC